MTGVREMFWLGSLIIFFLGVAGLLIFVLALIRMVGKIDREMEDWEKEDGRK